MDRQSYQSRRVFETPVPSGVYTQSGDTGPLKGYGSFKAIIAQLEVVAAPAPSGTLNVYIEHSLDGVNWWGLPLCNGAAFVPQQAPGVQMGYREDGMFSDTIRVRWDIQPPGT